MLSRPTRRPFRPSLLRCLTVVLLAVALVATACSDAHTQAQRDWVDTGYDPNVLTLLNPPELNPVLTALGQAFLSVRPNTSVVFLNKVSTPSGRSNRNNKGLTNTQVIKAGATPSLWIDEVAAQKSWAKDPRVQGPGEPFAADPMVLAVQAGNPAKISGLDAFAAGGPPTGRCSATQPCGSLAYAWLRAAHIPATFEIHVSGASRLLGSITSGKVDAGLVLLLDIPPKSTTLTTVPVASPPAPSLGYRMLVMSPDPTAAQFENWLSTSSQARAIISSYGLLPGTGKTGT